MAVYTEISDDALASFLAEYDIGDAVACKGIAEGVENSNFALRTASGDFILTLYERRVDVADLPYFLGLMQHLAERGIPCPRPVPGRDGAALRLVCGRAAAITTFLPGVSPRRVRPGRRSAGGDACRRRRVRADPPQCAGSLRLGPVAGAQPHAS
jgi:homoserine kinase type II